MPRKRAAAVRRRRPASLPAADRRRRARGRPSGIPFAMRRIGLSAYERLTSGPLRGGAKISMAHAAGGARFRSRGVVDDLGNRSSRPVKRLRACRREPAAARRTGSAYFGYKWIPRARDPRRRLRASARMPSGRKGAPREAARRRMRGQAARARRLTSRSCRHTRES
ncbi:protein of unknown function [Burkholderia multivorans]